MAGQDTPKLPPPIRQRRPLTDLRREPDSAALKAAGVRLPAPPKLPSFEPQTPPEPKRTGFTLKIASLREFAALITAIGAIVVSLWAKVEQPPQQRVDAHTVRLAEVESMVADERTERIAESEQQRATNVAIACRLRVLASVARRQGYESGFAEDLIWLSERIEAPNRPKQAPLWRTTERCPVIPGPQ